MPKVTLNVHCSKLPVTIDPFLIAKLGLFLYSCCCNRKGRHDLTKKRHKKFLFSPKIRKNAMRYGNGVADNMLSVFQITNEENACLSLKKQAQFLKLHSISGRSFAPLKKIVIVVA